MPPLSLSERKPFGLVVTPSSGSSLLMTAGRPGPLVGRLGDYVRVAERPAALRARRHELEGVPSRQVVGAGHQQMVADPARAERLPELRVPFRERCQRLGVLGS